MIVFYTTETDKFERTEFSYICETLHDRMFMNSNVCHWRKVNTENCLWCKDIADVWFKLVVFESDIFYKHWNKNSYKDSYMMWFYILIV